MDRKKVFIWSLYDFANSIVMIAFFLYFSQWLVIDRGVSDFWFNFTLTISSLLFLLVGPVLGLVADKTGNKVAGLRVTTVLTAVLYAVTGWMTLFYPSQILITAGLFTLAVTVYQLSFIYYNSFLKDLAPAGQRGVVSGWGIFGNYLGQIVGVLVCLPFATGLITLWGSPGRAQVFLPATLLFFVLTLPMLIYFKTEKRTTVVPKINLTHEYRTVWRSFIELCQTPGLGRFFAAYFFFNDAVITASNNFPIYLDRVFVTSDSLKSLILVGIMVTSAIGGPLAGAIGDRIGLKKTLLGILIGWVILFPAMALTTNLALFISLLVIMGLWFGSAWAVTRAIVLRYTPERSLSQSYTYYTLMERFATFVGPLSWGVIVAYGPYRGTTNYRLALVAMAAFVLIGLWIARKLPSEVKIA